MNLLEKHSSYVAYFDLLGFKRAILTNLEEACNRLETLRVAVEEKDKMIALPPGTLEPVFVGRRVRFFFFSDCILFYTLETTTADLIAIMGAAVRLMARSMLWQLPIRGGLSSGDFYVNEKYDVFCGVPVVRAYNLSEESQWMGLVADDAVAENYFSNQFSQEPTNGPAMLIEWDLPLMDGSIRKSWVFNWPVQLDRRNNNPITPEGLFEVFKPVFNCEYGSLEPDVQSKYANTSRFINFVDEKYRSGFAG